MAFCAYASPCALAERRETDYSVGLLRCPTARVRRFQKAPGNSAQSLLAIGDLHARRTQSHP